mgnify:CR=1 FL=1
MWTVVCFTPDRVAAGSVMLAAEGKRSWSGAIIGPMRRQIFQSRKLAEKVLFLDINWRGTTEDFCSSVDDHKINKERNKLSVVSVEGNSVLLEVK